MSATSTHLIARAVGSSKMVDSTVYGSRSNLGGGQSQPAHATRGQNRRSINCTYAATCPAMNSENPIPVWLYSSQPANLCPEPNNLLNRAESPSEPNCR